MTRCWLSGAGGFIGHHFLEHLLVNTDWHIIATDSFRHKGKTDRVSQVLDANPGWQGRVTILTHDLTVPFSEQMTRHISQVDYMIAMASESSVDRSIITPVPFVKNNIDITLSTVELARELRPEKFILVSTDEVYGPVSPGREPHPEWDAFIPSNPYSASKVAQEAICTSYWRTYGLPLIITNMMNIYGERQDAEKFLVKAIRAISEERELEIHGRYDEIGTRHYLHARNAADAHLFLLQNAPPALFPEAGRPGKYHIGGPEPVSNLALAQEVARILGKPLYYKLVDFHAAKPGHDPHYGLEMSRIYDLGWKPPVEFTESLERMVRWTVKNPEWMI